MEFSTLFFTLLFVCIMQIVIPFVVKRTVVFGVTIPLEETSNHTVRQYKKRYAGITTVIGLIVLASLILVFQMEGLSTDQMVLFGSFLPFVVLLGGLSLYFYFHFKMMKVKKARSWSKQLKQAQIANDTEQATDEMLPAFVQFIPVIVTAATIILTIRLFDQLPDQIPTHWGPNGQPDAYSDKTWLTALGLPLILFVLQIMFFSIHTSTRRSGMKVNAAHYTSAKLRQLRLRKYTSWFLLVINLLMTMLFTFLQLNVLYEKLFGNIVMILVPLGFLMLVLISTILLAIKVGSVDSDLEGKVPTDQKSADIYDDDHYWKAGLFYFNPNDKSIFVEKRFGIGWSINFANPVGYLLVIVPVVIILVVSFSM
ncbi:DUF1648 domain-containing protein [Gracilibacillus salinarum]|uniref:DUF1648 domain-containing protein n=1 Tax=Gracilibacillus salinarum TaxID=2932255 RepID=A0ABY4GRH5_9BACI|nr:DUF1648 domain-containing protein [Gracilibacillus salinarum]UOQ86791.1 DUF1648 domain-containing protein [Gracilibacillus salinarum]